MFCGRGRSLAFSRSHSSSSLGSSGRAHEFDLVFRPRRSTNSSRWVKVARVGHASGEQPPVLLIRVGEAYFVEDRNHRVSVARAKGKSTIAAKVVEIGVSDLTAKPSCTRLGYKLDGHESC